MWVLREPESPITPDIGQDPGSHGLAYIDQQVLASRCALHIRKVGLPVPASTHGLVLLAWTIGTSLKLKLIAVTRTA